MHVSIKCAQCCQQTLCNHTIWGVFYSEVDLESHWLICQYSVQPWDMEQISWNKLAVVVLVTTVTFRQILFFYHLYSKTFKNHLLLLENKLLAISQTKQKFKQSSETKPQKTQDSSFFIIRVSKCQVFSDYKISLQFGSKNKLRQIFSHCQRFPFNFS